MDLLQWQICRNDIVTSSETLANQLLCILSRFGILASIYIKKYIRNNKGGTVYHVGVQGKDVKKSLKMSMKFGKI